MKTNNNKQVTTPEMVPGIMELIRANKNRISIETYGMSFEETKAYFEQGRKENPIWSEEAYAKFRKCPFPY